MIRNIIAIILGFIVDIYITIILFMVTAFLDTIYLSFSIGNNVLSLVSDIFFGSLSMFIAGIVCAKLSKKNINDLQDIIMNIENYDKEWLARVIVATDCFG